MKNLSLMIAILLSLKVEARVTDWHLETIKGYMIEPDGISFQVYDGGCTRTEDFHIHVEKNKFGEASLLLYRKNMDPCKGFFPYGRVIRFDFNAIDISKNQAFKIDNPINPGFIRY